jgi:hypothetical protein
MVEMVQDLDVKCSSSGRFELGCLDGQIKAEYKIANVTRDPGRRRIGLGGSVKTPPRDVTTHMVILHRPS